MSVVYFLVIFSFLVGIHEWGHYQAARSLGIVVRDFAIGMGPKVFSHTSKKTGTNYFIRLFPIGGYVSFLQSDEVPEGEDTSKAFDVQPRWKKALVVAAGPFMNFVFAFALLVFVGLIGVEKMSPHIEDVVAGSVAEQAGFVSGDLVTRLDGSEVTDSSEFASLLMSYAGSVVELEVEREGDVFSSGLDLTQYTISRNDHLFPTFDLGFVIPTYSNFTLSEVLPGSAADKAGLIEGDVLTHIDGQKVYYTIQVNNIVNDHGENTISIKVERSGKELEVNLIPQKNKETGDYRIGVKFSYNEDYPSYFHIEYGNLMDSVIYGAEKTWFYSTLSIRFIKRLFQRDIDFNMVSGPIGIAKASESAANLGVVVLLSFVALLSANIGVMNLIPLPGLDGGHLLVYSIESVIRRPLNKTFENWAMKISGLLIVLVMISALYVDFIYS